MNFAKSLHPQSKISFIYVSGAGTDDSEKGKVEWARVKGKTENDLMKFPFKQVFAYRPMFMKIIAGQKHIPKWYRYGSWLFPVLKIIPGIVNSLQQVAQSMIYASQRGYGKSVVGVKDITMLAERALKNKQ
jgi:hypothetical protein